MCPPPPPGKKSVPPKNIYVPHNPPDGDRSGGGAPRCWSNSLAYHNETGYTNAMQRQHLRCDSLVAGLDRLGGHKAKGRPCHTTRKCGGWKWSSSNFRRLQRVCFWSPYPKSKHAACAGKFIT
eukprot:gene11842-biopygen6402